MSLAVKEHRAPKRYSLYPEETREISHLAKEQGGLRRRDIQMFQQRFNAASKPIHHVLDNLNLPVIGAKQTAETTFRNTSPAPAKTPTHSTADAEIAQLRASLERELEAAQKSRKRADAARAKANEEIAHAAEMTEKARTSLRQTAELRKSTAEERRIVDDLLEERDRLLERIQQIEHLDPNTAAFIKDISTIAGNGVRSDRRKRMSARVQELEAENKALRQQVADLTSTSTEQQRFLDGWQGDVADLKAQIEALTEQNTILQDAVTNLDGVEFSEETAQVQYLPIRTLEPLFVALHQEILRRQNGGRQKQRKLL